MAATLLMTLAVAAATTPTTASSKDTVCESLTTGCDSLVEVQIGGGFHFGPLPPVQGPCDDGGADCVAYCRYTFESNNRQALEQGTPAIAALRPDLSPETITQQLGLGMQAAAANAAEALCFDPDATLEDLTPSHCVSQEAPGDVAGVVVYCVGWCSFLPRWTTYGVGMVAHDEQTSADAVVVAGVGCAYRPSFPYIPPLGTMCAGLDRCEASLEHGLKYGMGSCTFDAFAASPKIDDYHCEW